jgi:stage II sporulation protein GA (sporulation sigma-E factor processing peptidase)
MRYVYGDVLFLINLVLDFALLWFIRRYGGWRRPTWRLWLAAAFGAGYALLVVFPGPWAAWPVRLLVALPLLLIAFAPLSLPELARGVTLLYGGAFVYGGAALALTYLRQSLQTGWSLSRPVTWGLVAGGFLLGGFLFWCFWQRRSAAATTGPVCQVAIELSGRQAVLTGLVDTGNQLRDPIGDAPVLVVDYEAVAELLPAELAAVYSEGRDDDLDRIGGCLAGSSFATRVRLVPFTSIGRRNGILIGFRPDAVRVSLDGATLHHALTVVCLYGGRLSGERAYQALLHPDLIRPADRAAG